MEGVCTQKSSGAVTAAAAAGTVAASPSAAPILPCIFASVYGRSTASVSDRIVPKNTAAAECTAAEDAAAGKASEGAFMGAGTTAGGVAPAAVESPAGDDVVGAGERAVAAVSTSGDISVFEGSYIFHKSSHERYLLHIDDDPYSLESFFGQHLRMGGAYWTFTSLWLLGSNSTVSLKCTRETSSTILCREADVVTRSNAEDPASSVPSINTVQISSSRLNQSTSFSLSKGSHSDPSSLHENCTSVTRCSPSDSAETAISDTTFSTNAVTVSDSHTAATSPVSSPSPCTSRSETLSSAAVALGSKSAPLTVRHCSFASAAMSLTATPRHTDTPVSGLVATASSAADQVDSARTGDTDADSGSAAAVAICFTPCATREDQLTTWIMSCQHSSGGFGQGPGQDPHITSTHYAVLLLLCMNRLHVLNKEKVATWIHQLKVAGGGFKGDIWGECDTRYAYCGAACLTLLGHFDRDTALQTALYVQKCNNVDGGYAWLPGGESHAASAFCCIATLALCERLAVVEREKLASWLLERQLQTGGFNGRPEKAPDVCYSFWILAALAIIGYMHWVDTEALTKFVLEAQDENGGIADRPGDLPDVFHTYFGIAALSLMHTVPGIKDVHPVFSIPCEVAYRENLGCCVLWG